jgi:hypothetical protein
LAQYQCTTNLSSGLPSLDDGTQNGLNASLIDQGDLKLRTLVRAIHNPPAWREGAIVVVGDDYTVDTNDGVHGVKSRRCYTPFSLHRSIESG